MANISNHPMFIAFKGKSDKSDAQTAPDKEDQDDHKIKNVEPEKSDIN